MKDSSVEPNSVKITGGREQLKKIAYLKATYKEANKLRQDTSDVADVTA
ncbi:YbbR-like domain-containing protein, partial [Staphylococcus aureus]|nr:YbbR-like domain-containing protein [Staphylococcus aureus]